MWREPSESDDRSNGVTPRSVEQLAWQVAVDAHAGQSDALGRPMLDHVRGVAELASERLGQIGVVVGLLHDVIEKGYVTRPELEAVGFEPDVLDLVELLTQWPGESSQVYLQRCADDPLASVIKEFDLVEKIDAARAINDDNARRQRVRWSGRLRGLRRLIERRPRTEGRLRLSAG